MDLGGRHAVVLGAGMAGLLTARVLSDHYERVTVVERDELAETPVQRKGVGQGRHLHALLSRGSQALEELFGGLCAELVAGGAHVIDDGDLSRVYTRMGSYGLNRTQKFADPEALTVYLASRPFLEFHVRRRVGALGNVTILDGHDAIAPVIRDGAVVGVTIANRDNGFESVVDTAMLVDATGRGARTPAFLTAVGYGRPDELRSSAHATYSSLLLRIPHGAFIEKLVLVVDTGPGSPRGGLTAYENDRWMLTVGRSMLDPEPPVDLAEMLAAAECFMPSNVMSGLRRAEPLGDVAIFRYTGAIWRRYDRVARFPAGLLIVGDALCSLNPIYGQGMTLAALQALALQDCMRLGEADIARRFFSAAAQLIKPVWEMNESRDGAQSAQQQHRVQSWITRRFLAAAENDIVLTEKLQRIGSLVDPPERLRDPTLIPRVLLGNLRRRTAN